MERGPCCLSAEEAVWGPETLRNLGLSRAGLLGDMGLTLGHCFWGHPHLSSLPSESSFDLWYAMIINIAQQCTRIQLNKSSNLALRSEIVLYVERSKEIWPQGWGWFHLFPVQTFMLNVGLFDSSYTNRITKQNLSNAINKFDPFAYLLAIQT